VSGGYGTCGATALAIGSGKTAGTCTRTLGSKVTSDRVLVVLVFVSRDEFRPVLPFNHPRRRSDLPPRLRGWGHSWIFSRNFLQGGVNHEKATARWCGRIRNGGGRSLMNLNLGGRQSRRDIDGVSIGSEIASLTCRSCWYGRIDVHPSLSCSYQSGSCRRHEDRMIHITGLSTTNASQSSLCSRIGDVDMPSVV